MHDAVTYSAVSHTATVSTATLSRFARQLDTRVAESRNPRSQALAHRMRAAASAIPLSAFGSLGSMARLPQSG